MGSMPGMSWPSNADLSKCIEALLHVVLDGIPDVGGRGGGESDDAGFRGHGEDAEFIGAELETGCGVRCKGVSGGKVAEVIGDARKLYTDVHRVVITIDRVKVTLVFVDEGA